MKTYLLCNSSSSLSSCWFAEAGRCYLPRMCSLDHCHFGFHPDDSLKKNRLIYCNILVEAKRDYIIILWQNAGELSIPICKTIVTNICLKVHWLTYTVKILEKCGIKLAREIFISEVCIFIFETETELLVLSIQCWFRSCTGLGRFFCDFRYEVKFKNMDMRIK